ncbi:hypothetical protein ACRALDRAFT_1080868 [Sodiomyces alcalophilus JCM 7366]|uniref:uncharacterized protein n=1 Tax=Sodiomyces alcalophilus JCM 7366 TaxID=591952 RepID=UPI0039B54495
MSHQNGTTPGSAVGSYMENGRSYGSYRRGRYMFPIDEEEKDRLDMFHKLLTLARNNRYWDAPLPERARVLDLGTGTGIWAIDVSDRLWKDPSNHGLVHGLDLSFIQPPDVPSSVSFMQADIEEPWPVHEMDYDLIHIQMLLGSIRDWTGLYRKCYRHIRPGGFLEHVEVEWKFQSDDNTLAADSPLITWSDSLHRAMRTAGVPLDVNERTKSELRTIGFTDVTETVIQLPINPWTRDRRQSELGRWFNLSLTHSIDALSLAPLTRVEHWPADKVLTLSADVKRHLCDLNTHAYCKLYIWTARKPSQ